MRLEELMTQDVRVVRVTLGEIVEAVASLTDDAGERVLILEYILRSRATRDSAAAGFRTALRGEP